MVKPRSTTAGQFKVNAVGGAQSQSKGGFGQPIGKLLPTPRRAPGFSHKAPIFPPKLPKPAKSLFSTPGSPLSGSPLSGSPTGRLRQSPSFHGPSSQRISPAAQPANSVRLSQLVSTMLTHIRIFWIGDDDPGRSPIAEVLYDGPIETLGGMPCIRSTIEECTTVPWSRAAFRIYLCGMVQTHRLRSRATAVQAAAVSALRNGNAQAQAQANQAGQIPPLSQGLKQALSQALDATHENQTQLIWLRLLNLRSQPVPEYLPPLEVLDFHEVPALIRGLNLLLPPLSIKE